MTPQQQHQCSQEINERLSRVTLSWHPLMDEWHKYAMQALEFASPASLQMPSKHYAKLFNYDTGKGIEANVAAILCNNLESTSPKKMGMDHKEYLAVLELNNQIAEQWEGLCGPIRKEVIEKYSQKPLIKSIHAQA